MKSRGERYLLFWVGLGVLLATVAANRVFASGLVDYRILYESFCRGWQGLGEKRFSFRFRLIFARLTQACILLYLGRRHRRRVGVPLALVWLGFGLGLSLTVMTWNRSVYGLLIFVASWLPHGLFYGLAWALALSGTEGGGSPRRGVLGGVAGLLLLGLLGEMHVNPWLLSLIPAV